MNMQVAELTVIRNNDVRQVAAAAFGFVINGPVAGVTFVDGGV